MSASIQVYLESGVKRTFAGAIDWPGWCRSGPGEAEALAALLDHGPKYAAILRGSRLAFVAPKAASQLTVVERLRGTATTDFGAPGVPPSADEDRACRPPEILRFQKILRAGWRAFDQRVRAARGKTLATGPRGGGRSLDAMVNHVVEADRGYLAALGWTVPALRRDVPLATQLAPTRRAILAALEASATGAIPSRGPRGGVRWTARWFVRRAAWHVIAHAWEIERRVAAGRAG